MVKVRVTEQQLAQLKEMLREKKEKKRYSQAKRWAIKQMLKDPKLRKQWEDSYWKAGGK